jgi:hypothetical protein
LPSSRANGIVAGSADRSASRRPAAPYPRSLPEVKQEVFGDILHNFQKGYFREKTKVLA